MVQRSIINSLCVKQNSSLGMWPFKTTLLTLLTSEAQLWHEVESLPDDGSMGESNTRVWGFLANDTLVLLLPLEGGSCMMDIDRSVRFPPYVERSLFTWRKNQPSSFFPNSRIQCGDNMPIYVLRNPQYYIRWQIFYSNWTAKTILFFSTFNAAICKSVISPFLDFPQRPLPRVDIFAPFSSLKQSAKQTLNRGKYRNTWRYLQFYYRPQPLDKSNQVNW